MLSDETFPSDLLSDNEQEIFEDEKVITKNSNFVRQQPTILKAGSTQSIEEPNLSSLSSTEDDLNSSTEIEEHSILINSMETDLLLKSTDFQTNTSQSTVIDDVELATQPESSFKSASSSIIKILPPPRAPIKKKKSFSCHNLNMKKPVNNYDHVESKVKKLIENLVEDRRKTLMRHKSMPVCNSQQAAQAIDEQNSESFDKDVNITKDMNDLKRELRRKSIKIYELEEKCEMKDSQIYDLERERSRMKMIFDKLRIEMQDLKEVEKQFKQLKSQYSPNSNNNYSHNNNNHSKSQRNALIQTEDSGIDSDYSKVNMRKLIEITTSVHNDTNRVLPHPVCREIAFEYSNIDTTHFSEINNNSYDSLIPEVENHLENIDLDEHLADSKNKSIDDIEEVQNDAKKSKKKKKKLKKFFNFVPCVSFK